MADVGVDAGADADLDSGSDSGADSGADSGSDAGADSGADSGVDAGLDAPAPDHVAFVSSTNFASTFGGLEAADLECERLADAAGLEGIFRAILSDSSVAARERITIAGRVVDTAGNVLAADATELWSGAIRTTLSRSETGASVGTSIVWTGTETDGSRDSANGHCGNWITGAGGAEAGRTDRSDTGWISIYGSSPSSAHACSNESRIYCIRSAD